MEINRPAGDLTAIGDSIDRSAGLVRRPVTMPMQSHASMRLTNLPPLVEAVKTPDEIVDYYLTYLEKEALVKYLVGYQKTQTDWDQYPANEIPAHQETDKKQPTVCA